MRVRRVMGGPSAGAPGSTAGARALAMARQTLQRARAALALLALGTARGARALDLCGVQTQGTVVVRAGEPATLACTYLVPGGSSLVLEPGAVVLATAATRTGHPTSGDGRSARPLNHHIARRAH